MTSGLAALLAKKKDASNEPAASSNVESTGDAQPAPVASTEPAAPAADERPKNPFAKKQAAPVDSPRPESADGGAPASGGNAGGDQQPRPRLASAALFAKPSTPAGNTSEVAPSVIDSLDALNASTDEGVAPRHSMSSFADETPASAPTRELPEGLTKEALGFVDMINGVYEVLHDTDLLGGVIRNIIIELKSNPEYMKLTSPDDIRLWVRGMRESMGLKRVQKQETKAKRGSGGAKAKANVDADMLADLDSLGISFD